ncbi:hypothetical protein SAMN05660657_05687 [Geodermatophilus amargosae]|uniref:Uncharacterized protein n=1 Tax=Geodermatophilus amargosae TaxID=1296565 RepID=A0A1I7DEJ5_9ACTN|nr:hypothetical protein [Geodermatophilus amargosae]SFU10122.1 hypothetical protein SAMN05660657_05687 [Geodermatophilus amargosae]
MTERTVRFFEITDVHGHRLPADLPFEAIRNAVNDVAEDKAYVSVGNTMEVLGSTYEAPTSGPRPTVPLITLDRITRDVRLRIERRRNYRPLVLGQDETWAEPTFFSLFPRNVLAVLRNSGSAPGVASFRDYINHLEILDGAIGVTPLADRNAVRAIADVDTLTKLTVAIGADVSPDDFDGTPLIADVLRQARTRLGAVGFEFTVKLATQGQAEASDIAVDELRQLVEGNGLAHVTKAQMTYRRLEDHRADTYNFIQEAVTTGVVVELVDQTVQPTLRSASEATAKAYNEDKYDDIQSALRLSD